MKFKLHKMMWCAMYHCAMHACTQQCQCIPSLGEGASERQYIKPDPKGADYVKCVCGAVLHLGSAYGTLACKPTWRIWLNHIEDPPCWNRLDKSGMRCVTTILASMGMWLNQIGDPPCGDRLDESGVRCVTFILSSLKIWLNRIGEPPCWDRLDESGIGMCNL